MTSTRLPLGLVGIAAAALVVALPAAGKDGVKATLTTRVPLGAQAGTQLRVAWKLASQDGQPFGAGEIFVRLVGTSRSGAETTLLSCYGQCSAEVRVPKGGIHGIQIGIRGYATNGPGDMLFPITNNPLTR